MITIPKQNKPVERVLMCRPTYFDVVYEINPWMHVDARPDRNLALKQWENLLSIYKDLGVKVELVDPIPGQPDMVFTANAGLVYKKIFIPSRFKFEERRGEESGFREWFSNKGYEIIDLPSGISFEGEADRIIRKGSLLVAHGFRTDEAVAKRLGDVLGVSVLQVNLINPHFYHLDTCLAYFEHTDTILYYPKAFDQETQLLLSQEFSSVIPVNDEEARKYVCNSISIGNVVIMNEGCLRAKEELEQVGYSVMTVNTSEFMKSGGSIKCMTLKLS